MTSKPLADLKTPLAVDFVSHLDHSKGRFRERFASELEMATRGGEISADLDANLDHRQATAGQGDAVADADPLGKCPKVENQPFPRTALAKANKGDFGLDKACKHWETGGLRERNRTGMPA
jgi:hypothetical protein